jgi:L,D-transpeptidase ErfK/SrfK
MFGERVLFLTFPYLRGTDVEQLQLILIRIGYNPGAVDGVFGPLLKNAVIAFQKNNNLNTTGIVDAPTIRELKKAAGSIPSYPSQPLDGDTYIKINTSNLRLSFYKYDKLVKTYPVAVGKPNTPTPPGDWKVVTKQINPGGALGSRWMGLNVPWASYGIHGTNNPPTIGTRASMGCIRMYNHDVEELFEQVKIGTPVYIHS